MDKDDLEWLHRFINCAVFSPPPSECQRAHRIVDALAEAARPEETARDDLAKALIQIALSPDEDNEWDGTEKYRAMREIACKALNWHSQHLPQRER